MTELVDLPVVDAPAVEPARFAEVFCEYAPRLRRYARRWLNAADADDVVQETLARALANWERLDHQRDVWPWLSVVARNLAFDQLRRRPTCAMPEDDALPVRGSHEWDSAPEQAAVSAERADLISQLYASLSPGQQIILRLRVSNGMDTAQIAELVGSSEAAVRQTLFRARRTLQSRFVARGGSLPAAAPFGLVLAAGGWLRRHLRDLTSATVPAAAMTVAAVAAVVVSLSPLPATDAEPTSRAATETAVVDAAPVRHTDPVPVDVVVPSSPRPAVDLAEPSAGLTLAPEQAEDVAVPLPGTPSVEAEVAENPLAPGVQYMVDIEVLHPAGDSKTTADGHNEGSGPVCSLGVLDCSP